MNARYGLSVFMCSWVFMVFGLVWISKIPLHCIHGVLSFVACIMSEACYTTENHKNNSNYCVLSASLKRDVM